MSAGHHQEDHSMEQKPVSFTVPFFLATATLLAVVLFLSLCDPKPHHAGAEGHGHEGASTEASHHGAAVEHHEEKATDAVENSDTLPVETAETAITPTHH
jgi:hypothetical protein